MESGKKRALYILIAIVIWSLTLGSQIAGRIAQCFILNDEWWRLMQEIGFGLGLGIPALLACIYGAVSFSKD